MGGWTTPLLLKEGRLAKRVGVVLKDAKLPLMPAKRSVIGALRGSFTTTPALRAFPSFKRRGDSNPHPPVEINGRHGTQPVFQYCRIRNLDSSA